MMTEEADSKRETERAQSLLVARDFRQAEDVFRQILSRTPQDESANLGLAQALQGQQRDLESLQVCQTALMQSARSADVWHGIGTVQLAAGLWSQSMQSFTKALELDPEHSAAKRVAATILMGAGRFSEAAQLLQQIAGMTARDQECSPWDGNSSLEGRRVVVRPGHTPGDVILWTRAAVMLQQKHPGCEVSIQAEIPMHALASQCAAVSECVPPDADLSAFDYQLRLGELLNLVGESSAAIQPIINYLPNSCDRLDHWRAATDVQCTIKIGIAWRDDAERFSIEDFARIAAIPGVELFSLQEAIGHQQSQLKELSCRSLDLPWDSDSIWAELAAVTANLDMVISVDDAVTHLAGAMSVPVWHALSIESNWHWFLDRPDSPWYPTMRVFRSTVGQPRTSLSEIHTLLAQRLGVVVGSGPGVDDGQSGFNRMTRARDGWMLYNRNDIYIGRSVELYGEFSEGEADLFRQLVRPGHTVIEAGANIGVHTLVFSKCVGTRGRVYAFEPQRIVFQTLCANMAMNSRANVYCYWQAMGHQAGTTTIPALDYRAQNNFGGFSLGDYQNGETVPVGTIDQLNLPQCHFLKADVEGMEMSVLQGATGTIDRHHPILYVENDREENSQELIRFIHSLGYVMYWHRPRLFNPKNYMSNGENVFDNIASLNMLCIHQSVPSQIAGLERVKIE